MTVGREDPAGEQGTPAYGEGRDAILRATIRVVARQGLRNLTFRAVGAEAKVSHALVAHHMGTRDNLIAEALRYSRRQTESIVTPTTASGLVDDFAAGAERLALDDPDLQAFLYELILESRRQPDLHAEVRQIYADWRAMTQETLSSLGVADPAAAMLVFAALDGLALQQLVLGADDPTSDALRLLRQLIEMLRAGHEAGTE